MDDDDINAWIIMIQLVFLEDFIVILKMIKNIVYNHSHSYQNFDN